jgi:hypothetical protein
MVRLVALSTSQVPPMTMRCAAAMPSCLLAQAAELAIRRKTESISLDLLIDAAAAGVFKFPAEQEPDALA